MSDKQNIIDYAREEYAKLESHRKIPSVIEAVKEKFNVTVSRKFVRYWCEEKVDELSGKVDESLKKLDAALEDKRSYDIEGESVVFHVDKKRPDGSEYTEKYAIPFAEIKEIWYDYSQHGKNLSAKNVLIEHGLKRETLSLLRSRLGLTKDDNAIPQVVLDYMYENYGEEAVEKEIIAVTHRAYEDKFKKKFVQADKREVDRLVRVGKDFETQLDEVRGVLSIFEPANVEFVPRLQDNGKTKIFVISDVHIGKVGTDGIISALDKIFQSAAKCEETNVKFIFLGDLGETFAQDGMHPGQIEYGTESKWGYGFDLAVNIADILEKFFIALHKTGKNVSIDGICGNHGRFAQKNEHDKKRTAELVIYEFLKLRLSKIEIGVNTLREKTDIVDVGNLRLVINHGDGNFDKQKPEQALLPRYRSGAYHIALSGDKHHLNMTEGFGYTWIKSPALAGKGEYDTDNNFHSERGYLTITENESGTADIEIKRLP